MPFFTTLLCGALLVPNSRHNLPLLSPEPLLLTSDKPAAVIYISPLAEERVTLVANQRLPGAAMSTLLRIRGKTWTRLTGAVGQ